MSLTNPIATTQRRDNDMTDKTKTCPRCGLKLKRVTITHTRACDKLPPPLQLTAMFMNNSDMTLSDLSNQYDISWRFIRVHINHGAELIYGAKGIERIGNEVRDRAERLSFKASRGYKKPSKGHRCKNCKILLDHPKVTAVGNLCSVCAGEEPNHYLLAV